MKERILLTATALILSFLPCSQNHAQNLVKDEQGNVMLPGQKGQYEVIAFYDDDYTGTLPENKVRLFENKLNGIINAFLKHQLLSPPTGFDAHFNKRIASWHEQIIPDDFPADINSKLAAQLEIAFAPYFFIDHQPLTDFHITSILNIYLNNPYNIAGSPVMADIYPCPKEMDKFHGYPVYITNRREVTIINFSGKALFIPVSQEEFIQTLLTYWESKIEKDQSDNEAYIEEFENFSSKETQQQQKEDFERAYNQMLKYDKSAAGELKKTYEEAMTIYADETGVPIDNEMMTGSITFEEEQIARLEQELLSMTPYERKRQAYYSVDAFEDFDKVSGLLPESHKNDGDALVRINPELINDHVDQIQLVSIQWDLLINEHSDSPRLARPGNKPDFLTDNKILTLYHDKTFWERFFQIIKQ